MADSMFVEDTITPTYLSHPNIIYFNMTYYIIKYIIFQVLLYKKTSISQLEIDVKEFYINIKPRPTLNV